MDMAHAETRASKATMEVVMGGSLAEGIVGTGGMALAILGLAGVYPGLMLSISTVAVGAALLFEGGAVASRLSHLMASTQGRMETEVGSGVTAEFIGGLAGVALGILSLMGVLSTTLIPIAAIIYGGALIMGAGVTSRINAFAISRSTESEGFQQIAREASSAASGVQVLIGIATITLGILALVDFSPLTLSLVAMLSVGFADMLTGTTIASRMIGIFRR